MKTVTSILLGKSGVGKTIFLTTASEGTVPRHPVHSTIGIENITFRHRGVSYHCWDTAGNDRFKQVVPVFFRNCDVAIYMFRPEDQSTLDYAIEWYDIVSKTRDGPDIHIFIANTKAPASSIPVNTVPSEILLVGSVTNREDVQHILNAVSHHTDLSPGREFTYSAHSLTPIQARQCCDIQ